MTFFARPNLDDVQFKQLTGTTLTMSGTTDFVGTLKSKGVEIDGTATSYGEVLTYDGSKIKLMPSSASGGTGVYLCASPTTCTVGGLNSGTPISGCTLSYILEKILVPTVSPTVQAPSLIYTINPSTVYYEAGCTASITGCIQFSRGSNSPQYCGSSAFRSGLPNTHKYQKFDGSFCCCTPLSALNSNLPMTRTISVGANISYGSVCYDAGTTLYDSAGGTAFIAPNPLPSGVTSPSPQIVCGVMPWYYGKKVTNVISGADVVAGTKGTLSTLASSTLPIVYNSSPSDYLWFAVPNGTPAKTAWFVCASNQGVIGGINNLFASACPQSVTSTFGCVCTYDVYVTCITTGTAPGVPMCMS